MRLGLNRTPKGPRKPRDLVKAVLTKHGAIPTKRFTCIGGPFDGKDIKLTTENLGRRRTFTIKVDSFENGRPGFYAFNDEHAECVVWEFV